MLLCVVGTVGAGLRYTTAGGTYLDIDEGITFNSPTASTLVIASDEADLTITNEV